jgi:replication factor A1
MKSIDELVDQLKTLLKEYEIVEEDKVLRDRAVLLRDTFQVPDSEIIRSVANWVLHQHGKSLTSAPKDSPLVKVQEIHQKDKWISLNVKVVQLWEPASESIAQTGLVGDETGIIKFVSWAKSDLPKLAEGESYHLENVISDIYQDKPNIKLTKATKITQLTEKIDANVPDVTFEGACVQVSKGSGLIKRCPQCKRALASGICGEHGKVEGTHDLRIKAVLDDGAKAQNILINAEGINQYFGLTLERAREMAMEALATEVVDRFFREKMFGRYFKVIGHEIGDSILVAQVVAI